MGRISTSVRPAYRTDEIVDIAVRVFLERGYDATSMSDLAKAAQITKSSFYHHVSSKEGLFELGVGRALDALFQVLKANDVKRWGERFLDALTGPPSLPHWLAPASVPGP